MGRSKKAISQGLLFETQREVTCLSKGISQKELQVPSEKVLQNCKDTDGNSIMGIKFNKSHLTGANPLKLSMII